MSAFCVEIAAGGSCGLPAPCTVHSETPASERLAHPSPTGSVGGVQREGYEPGPGIAGSAPAPNYEAVLADVYDEYDCASGNGAVHRGRRDRFVADAMFRIRPLVASEVAAALEAQREEIAAKIEAWREQCKDHWPIPNGDCWRCQRHAVYTRAARIARGSNDD